MNEINKARDTDKHTDSETGRGTGSVWLFVGYLDFGDERVANLSTVKR